jgi:hypothetical protein
MRADGRVMEPGFPNAAEAEAAAGGLFDHGYKTIEVIDLVSKRVIKRLHPQRTV